MRNLIAFLRRFRLFLAFTVLQIIALALLFNMNEFASIQFMSTTSSVNATVFKWRNNVDKHFYLETNNEKLARENAFLRARLKESNYQVKRDKILIEDTTYKNQYTYIPGNVIQSTYDKRNNYMTVDVGTIHGVKRGDGVISADGVVGIVHLVQEHYCLVKTVLSKNINLDVTLDKVGAFGLLKWDQKSPRIVQVEGVSSDIYFKKWSKVVTRGNSGLFPKGIPVGTVTKRKTVNGEPQWDISLALSTDFRTIQKVYIVHNDHLKEIQDLQIRIPADKSEDDE
jgi:rod shape-determining protein MreC